MFKERDHAHHEWSTVSRIFLFPLTQDHSCTEWGVSQRDRRNDERTKMVIVVEFGHLRDHKKKHEDREPFQRCRCDINFRVRLVNSGSFQKVCEL